MDTLVDSNDSLFQESKNIIFTCGDSKNHSWPSPLVIFSVPTRENNVFYPRWYVQRCVRTDIDL
jgi:hypothetical protein